MNIGFLMLTDYSEAVNGKLYLHRRRLERPAPARAAARNGPSTSASASTSPGTRPTTPTSSW